MARPGNTSNNLTFFRSLDVKKKWADGYVYYLFNGKQYRRLWVLPNNPKTPAQQATRSIFAEAVASWQALPVNEKDYYREYARYLELKMSGYNLYIRIYIRLNG